MDFLFIEIGWCSSVACIGLILHFLMNQQQHLFTRSTEKCSSLIVKRNEYDCLESKNTIWNAFSFVFYFMQFLLNQCFPKNSMLYKPNPSEYICPPSEQTFSLWPNKRSENRFEFIFRLFRWLMTFWSLSIHAIFSKLNIWCPFKGTVKLYLYAIVCVI